MIASYSCKHASEISGSTFHQNISFIGASRSEPHTNHHYEKITVAIRRPRVHHARACSARGNDLYRITYVSMDEHVAP